MIRFIRSLSGRLLLLTLVFVLLIEAVIFVPSAAAFRRDWLEERVSDARLLTTALMSDMDYEGGVAMTEAFMRDTEIVAIMQRKPDRNELILGMQPVHATFKTIDMRDMETLPSIGQTLGVYFGDGEDYLRLLARPASENAVQLEVFVPERTLRQALIDYCHRIILLSLIISVVLAAAIYAVLSFVIVRPIKRMEEGIARFREAPERPVGLTPSKRRDEIGAIDRELADMRQSVRASLKQKDHLAALGLAVAKINHDLRNVLTTANLISDRLAMDKDPRVRSMGERLVRNIDRGIEMCADTLQYGQTTEAEPDRQNIVIKPLLDEAYMDAAEALGAVRWQNDVADDVKVFADPEQFFRIVHNLVRNALQALHGHHRPDPGAALIQIRAAKAKSFVEIEISDNGPGLPEKAKANLFKPFEGGASKKGTGLGLAIARELAEAGGGALRLEQTGPDGTTFNLRLPAPN